MIKDIIQLENDVKRKIIVDLIHNKQMTFTELLKDTNIKSNLFNFHLKKLIDTNLIEKKNDLYTLTQEGRSLAPYIDSMSRKYEGQPSCTIQPIIWNKDKTKILLQKRSKEPFSGYLCLLGGKIKKGESLKETCIREIKEESNLDVDAKLRALISERIYKDNKLIYHHLMHIFETTQIDGEVKYFDREGENIWVDPKEVISGKEKTIGDNPIIVKKILESNENLIFAEIIGEEKDGEIHFEIME